MRDMYRNEESNHSRLQVVTAEAQSGDEAIEAPVALESTQARGPAPSLPGSTEVQAAPIAKAAKKRPNRRRIGMAIVALLAVGGAGWYGYDYLTVGRFMVSTDDAYVQAYNTTLAAKVAGYLASVPVTDNTYVHVGDVIATIDDGDYRLAIDSARGKVATQQATIGRIGHQITA